MSFRPKRGGLKLVPPLAILVTLSLLAGASSTSAAPPPRPLATFTVDRSDAANPENSYSWRVPKGVKRVRFEVFGATGGREAAAGGLGGEADATYSVTPGQAFQIVIGGAGTTSGAGGLNGGGNGGAGGGGGASDVRACAGAASELCSLSDRFVVAGGGGGASGGVGGAGGGLSGADGGGPEGGQGGTQTAGGASCDGCAGAGGFGFGGTGESVVFDGGGGGGGWYGGAGGGPNGGGGGGSGYIHPLALSSSFATGVWSAGDGKVVIYKG